MNWKINRDHVIRLIQTDTECWQFQYPFKKLIIDMLKLQERVDNPKSESREFYLSLPHHEDTLTLWSCEYDAIRKDFNKTSFADYTSKILELEFRLENITPHWHPEVARVLLYHYESTEIWYQKDKRALKYVTEELPSWDELKKDTKLVMTLFA